MKYANILFHNETKVPLLTEKRAPQMAQFDMNTGRIQLSLQ